MACGKGNRCNDVRNDKDSGGNVFPVVFSAKYFPDEKCQQGHEEQPHHQFLYDTAVEDACQNAVYRKAFDVAGLYDRNATAEYPMVKAEQSATY